MPPKPVLIFKLSLSLLGFDQNGHGLPLALGLWTEEDVLDRQRNEFLLEFTAEVNHLYDYPTKWFVPKFVPPCSNS